VRKKIDLFDLFDLFLPLFFPSLFSLSVSALSFFSFPTSSSFSFRSFSFFLDVLVHILCKQQASGKRKTKMRKKMMSNPVASERFVNLK